MAQAIKLSTLSLYRLKIQEDRRKGVKAVATDSLLSHQMM
jgi:hypothetical protein